MSAESRTSIKTKVILEIQQLLDHINYIKLDVRAFISVDCYYINKLTISPIGPNIIFNYRKTDESGDF